MCDVAARPRKKICVKKCPPPQLENRICCMVAQYVKYFCLIVAPVVQIAHGFVMLYVLKYVIQEPKKNFVIWHIFFCTLGLNFLQVQAILINNMASVKCREKKQRAYAHAFLQTVGLITNIAGIIYIAEHGKNIGGVNIRASHSVLGIAATILSAAALVSGAYAIAFHWPINIIHILFGLPCFILSSASLGIGLDIMGEKEHIGKNYYTICVACIYAYSGIIVLFIVLKVVLRVTARF